MGLQGQGDPWGPKSQGKGFLVLVGEAMLKVRVNPFFFDCDRTQAGIRRTAGTCRHLLSGVQESSSQDLAVPVVPHHV